MHTFISIALSTILSISFVQHASAANPQKITKTLQGITFNSDFDNGSLQNVTEVTTDSFNCSIYTETGELGSATYWFRFRMTGIAGRSISLNITHAQSPRPVISLDGGLKWRRLTAEEAPNTSSVILTFATDQPEAELAFFYPSGVEETYNAVNDMVRSCDFASSEVLGLSYQGREMLLVTVTDSNHPDTHKHRVWVHSRAHAGEVTSTLLMRGMLDQITDDTPEGKRLRYGCIFNIVPLQNVDGVWLGHTRWDSQGIDPERQWPNPSRIPEVSNIKTAVDGFMSSSNPIEVALNLHSTQGNYTDTFFFKHLYPSVTKNFETIQQNFIDAFDNNTPLFDNLSPGSSQLSATLFIESYFWNNWGEAVMAMTHEGHFRRRITDNEWITNDDYHELGRAMARAMIEYFDLPEVPASSVDGWILY